MNLRTIAACLLVPAAGCTALPGPAIADFARIHPGMSQEEARRVLGPPQETMRFGLSRTVSWDYRLMDTWGYLSLCSVMFDAEGRVTGIVTQRLNDGGDHS
jgi:outer membrane protein assembly factor BamE (lipoprotein component of BamABCDE complex)